MRVAIGRVCNGQVSADREFDYGLPYLQGHGVLLVSNVG